MLDLLKVMPGIQDQVNGHGYGEELISGIPSREMGIWPLGAKIIDKFILSEILLFGGLLRWPL